MRTQPEPLPAAVLRILGTGLPRCSLCHGDGVVVLMSFTGPVIRPCQCVAGTPKRGRPAGPDLWVSQPVWRRPPLRASRPTSRRRTAG
jgi:hypothetical protein